jgi:hypothetical protein
VFVLIFPKALIIKKDKDMEGPGRPLNPPRKMLIVDPLQTSPRGGSNRCKFAIDNR